MEKHACYIFGELASPSVYSTARMANQNVESDLITLDNLTDSGDSVHLLDYRPSRALYGNTANPFVSNTDFTDTRDTANISNTITDTRSPYNPFRDPPHMYTPHNTQDKDVKTGDTLPPQTHVLSTGSVQESSKFNTRAELGPQTPELELMEVKRELYNDSLSHYGATAGPLVKPKDSKFVQFTGNSDSFGEYNREVGSRAGDSGINWGPENAVNQPQSGCRTNSTPKRNMFTGIITNTNDNNYSGFHGLEGPSGGLTDGFHNQDYSLRPKRKPITPQCYEGSTDFRDYIVHFERVADWNKWDSYEKAQQLMVSLKGSAQRVLSDLTLGQTADFWQLRTALMDKFQPPGREAQHRCEFKNRKLKPDENISEYGEKLKRLAALGYPSMSTDARETCIIDRFIDGLDDFETRKHVQFGHPNTLQQAINLALEYGAVENPHGLLKPQARVDSAQGNVQNGSDSDNVSKLSAAVEQLQKQISALGEDFATLTSKRTVSNLCWGCKLPGHRRRDCKTNPYPDRARNSHSRAGNNNEGAEVRGN